jgi:hypothetical protein
MAAISNEPTAKPKKVRAGAFTPASILGRISSTDGDARSVRPWELTMCNEYTTSHHALEFSGRDLQAGFGNGSASAQRVFCGKRSNG